MSLDIIDGIQWSDPIVNRENYNILQEEHWRRSDIPPEKEQLRLVLLSSELKDLSKPLWLLYTPALSSVNSLDEFPHEINNCWLVKCKLNKIPPELHSQWSYLVM